MPAGALHPTPPIIPSSSGEAHAQTALVPAASLEPGRERSGGGIDRNSVVCRMPVELQVAVPVREFRIRNLVALSAGTVVASRWRQGEDLPLGTGEVQLAWVEFEIVDAALAARITRPA